MGFPDLLKIRFRAEIEWVLLVCGTNIFPTILHLSTMGLWDSTDLSARLPKTLQDNIKFS